MSDILRRLDVYGQRSDAVGRMARDARAHIDAMATVLVDQEEKHRRWVRAVVAQHPGQSIPIGLKVGDAGER